MYAPQIGGSVAYIKGATAIDSIKAWLDKPEGTHLEIPCSDGNVAEHLTEQIHALNRTDCWVEIPKHDCYWMGAPHKIVADPDGFQRFVRVFWKVCVDRPIDAD
jgi:hypothetical protein